MTVWPTGLLVSLCLVSVLCFCDRLYTDCRTIQTTLAECYDTVSQGIQSVVLTYTYILARVVACATLTYDDVTCNALFTTENLNTESLRC